MVVYRKQDVNKRDYDAARKKETKRFATPAANQQLGWEA